MLRKGERPLSIVVLGKSIAEEVDLGLKNADVSNTTKDKSLGVDHDVGADLAIGRQLVELFISSGKVLFELRGELANDDGIFT